MKKYKIQIFSLIVLLFCGEYAAAEGVYVIEGPRGSVTFTTRKPSDGVDYRVVTGKISGNHRFYRRGGRWRPRAMTSQYDDLIKKMAVQHSLEPALVKAVVHVESAFQPQARSPKGAMGLMQLMPGTARRFGVQNAYHPTQNVLGGVRYLRMLYDRYRGNLRLAVAAYNAGEGAVDRTRNVPPYAETQEYVRRVLMMLQVYRCVDKGQANCAA